MLFSPEDGQKLEFLMNWILIDINDFFQRKTKIVYSRKILRKC